MTVELKKCSKCGEEKPKTSEFFAFQNKDKGLFKSQCKVCNSSYRKKAYQDNIEANRKKALERYHKNRDENLVRMRKWQQENKDYHRNKMRENYHKNRDERLIKMRKWQQENKDYFEKWNEVNKERISIRTSIWKKNNIDKCRVYNQNRRSRRASNGGEYTKEQWQETLEYFNNRCAYSGADLNNSNTNVEHIIPISKGGTSWIWNLVPSLDKVNVSKHNNNMEEWYRQQPYFSEERLNKIYEYQEYMFKKYGC